MARKAPDPRPNTKPIEQVWSYIDPGDYRACRCRGDGKMTRATRHIENLGTGFETTTGK